MSRVHCEPVSQSSLPWLEDPEKQTALGFTPGTMAMLGYGGEGCPVVEDMGLDVQ
jgi:hypothetical protein